MKKDIFVKIKWSLRRLWPRFLTQKFAANIYKTKFADIMQNVWKSKKGGSVKADFFVEGLHSKLRKKLKIATLTEAPFMVKLDFWKNKYFFFKYLRNNFWGKYLKLSQTFNLTLFLPSSNEELCISSPKIVSGIFGRW